VAFYALILAQQSVLQSLPHPGRIVPLLLLILAAIGIATARSAVHSVILGLKVTIQSAFLIRLAGL
jgi:hypothetical protein